MLQTDNFLPKFPCIPPYTCFLSALASTLSGKLQTHIKLFNWFPYPLANFPIHTHTNTPSYGISLIHSFFVLLNSWKRVFHSSFLCIRRVTLEFTQKPSWKFLSIYLFFLKEVCLLQKMCGRKIKNRILNVLNLKFLDFPIDFSLLPCKEFICTSTYTHPPHDMCINWYKMLRNF